MIIKLPENYAVARQARSVAEAFQFIGEECIFLRMRHAAIDGTDAINPAPRCTRCWDADYNQASDEYCPNCYGTTFDQPIAKMGRIWSLFSDNTSSRELLRKWGEWQTDDREVQIESVVDADEHDYIIRVMQWSPDHRPLEIQGRYRIDNTLAVSLRTGNRLGLQAADTIGTTCKAHFLSSFHPVMQFKLDPTVPVSRFEQDTD